MGSDTLFAPSGALSALGGSWARAWSGIGALNPGTELCAQVLARYGEPTRHYHSLQHLAECLGTFETVRHLPGASAEVEVALWFHDAVYDIGRPGNEARSADWARSALVDAGVPGPAAARVHELVLATRHTAVPDGPAAQLLVDIDLAILGAPVERFEEYERQIRAEYAHVPGWLFRRKRRAILRGFLERPVLYGTAHFRAALESRARANLERATGGARG